MPKFDGTQVDIVGSESICHWCVKHGVCRAFTENIELSFNVWKIRMDDLYRIAQIRSCPIQEFKKRS